MNSELAEWFLDLPEPVRRELRCMHGAFWWVRRSVEYQNSAWWSLSDFDNDVRPSAPNYLPTDPFAVVQHAASLVGKPFGCALLWDPESPSGPFRAIIHADTTLAAHGPTPIQASVALLQKAMEARKP